MPAVRLTGFIGEQPRIIASLLPPNAAKSAVNVRLDDGGLTPIHQSVQVHTLGAAGAQTIYKHGATWLSWSTIVHAAPGPVADDRLYFTGDGVPKVKIAGTDYPLAIAAPTPALTAALGGVGAGDVIARIYVYTWVTSFGEESEPNPASNSVNWQPGNNVTLSGFAATPAGRGITLQRIYRSQTGQSGTGLFLIAERAATSANYVDTVAVDAFAEPLPSADWTPPPDALSGLVALANGMMAAFKGKDVYFCEPFRPHAWPEKYVLSMHSEIVGLGAIGSALVVTTKAQPYFVQGSHPSVMQSVKLEANLPCINGRGIVDLGVVIAYPSHEGLVAVGADGSIRVVTANLFNRDAWQALAPETIVAGQLSGRYVAFYDTEDVDGNPLAGAIFIDIGDAPYVIRADNRAGAAYFELGTGSLYYLESGGDDIYRLDAPDGARETLYWRSKEFQLISPENFGIILVNAEVTLSGQEQLNTAALIAQITAANTALLAAGSIGGELNAAPLNQYAMGGDLLGILPSSSGGFTVGVYADGTRVAQITRTNVPVRLKGGFRASTWEIDVSSDLQVSRIILGRTVDDLREVPA